MTLSIFSYACWPPVCPLWRNIYLFWVFPSIPNLLNNCFISLWPNAPNKIHHLQRFYVYRAVMLSVFTLFRHHPSPERSPCCKTESLFPVKQLLPRLFLPPAPGNLNVLTTTHYSIVWKNRAVSRFPPWRAAILLPVWEPQTLLQGLYWPFSAAACWLIY